MTEAADRKLRGGWYTPDELVERVVDAAIVNVQPHHRVSIVDPACGDGRFLVAAARRVCELGGVPSVVGVDIDAVATTAAARELTAAGIEHRIVHADALTMDWTIDERFDLVIGNPPFLSQMSAATTRGGTSSRSGGPYSDAAVEFLALAGEIVRGNGGRVAFVLPQSLLSARDAGSVRATYDERATMTWNWWTGEKVFDAQVLTCALVFEFGHPVRRARCNGEWSHVIIQRSGVPTVPTIDGLGAGTLGDRCRLNANFRDEYYGMIPAVGDHTDGPRLVTSGLIDPGRCWWGSRSITFAKRRFERPRIDLDALDGKMPKWAADRLVPKVLIANQTKIIEAVADADGTMLPGVPVVAAYPTTNDPARAAWEIAAVLTSPFASAWAWHRSAGTGLSADAIRIGPVMLADLPWPCGDLSHAVARLRADDIRGCADAVLQAYGLDWTLEVAALMAWWTTILTRIESRQPTDVTPLLQG